MRRSRTVYCYSIPLLAADDFACEDWLAVVEAGLRPLQTEMNERRVIAGAYCCLLLFMVDRLGLSGYKGLPRAAMILFINRFMILTLSPT